MDLASSGTMGLMFTVLPTDVPEGDPASNCEFVHHWMGSNWTVGSTTFSDAGRGEVGIVFSGRPQADVTVQGCQDPSFNQPTSTEGFPGWPGALRYAFTTENMVELTHPTTLQTATLRRAP